MAPKPLALETELFRFRDKLLDSSLRNPLLNYRVSKRKTVEIVPVSADDAYDRLVNNSNWLRLLPEANIRFGKTTCSERADRTAADLG
jgi:hypothetical protein